MPFSDDKIKNIQEHCVSLQVTRRKVKSNFRYFKIKKWKRVCLFTSKASVTVEASLTMSVFIIVIISIISFLALINAQLSLEHTLNNMSLETAKAQYYFLYEKGKTTNYKSLVDAECLSARLFASIKPNNEKLAEGWNITKSKIEKGKVDVVLSYDLKIPFSVAKWNITQRAKTKDWTGVDLNDQGEIVYITKNGTVYHKTKECKHLIIDILETTFAESQKLRNNSGHKYKKCEYCVHNSLSNISTVFITPDGDRYHSSLQCSGLTRSLIEINIKDIGNKRPCSDCGG